MRPNDRVRNHQLRRTARDLLLYGMHRRQAARQAPVRIVERCSTTLYRSIGGREAITRWLQRDPRNGIEPSNARIFSPLL